MQYRIAAWSPLACVAFRFLFVYLTLYCFLTQVIGALIPVPGWDPPVLGVLTPIRQVVILVAQRVFGYHKQLVYDGSGSGDKTYDWVLCVCMLAVAICVAVAWSLLSQRHEYNRLLAWCRVGLRFALAGQLIVYGLVKINPMQMPYPTLQRLLEPFGNFSPMGVLWASVGAATAYEIFVGTAEFLGGLLLLIPQTAMLGALIAVMDLVEVFVLNMTYDVPVKLLSFHLLVMAAFLLIPERNRLLRFHLGQCAVEPPVSACLFQGLRANRVSTIVQVTFGLVLVASTLFSAAVIWPKQIGPGQKLPIYGIWTIDEMEINGRVRAPLLTDYDRWRRLIFDNPQWMAFQRMDDTFGGFQAKFDQTTSRLQLTKAQDKKWTGYLNVKKNAPSRLLLEGELNQQTVRMKLTLLDKNCFLLVSRGFHWVQDYPFNR